ncbi:MAG: hypothetical protein Q7S96_04070 [bacterium]|nr:hypothetical protein [bacterium]
MLKRLILAVVALVLLGFGCFAPKYLAPPEFIKLPDATGSPLRIEGVGFKGATTLLYVDDELVESLANDKSGNFSTELLFLESGQIELHAKQQYGGTISEPSSAEKVLVDVDPPEESLTLLSEIPSFTTAQEFSVKGRASLDSFVVVNDRAIEVDSDGNFVAQLPLKEGTNKFTWKLQDVYGNDTGVLKSSEIVVDATAPEISTSRLALSFADRMPQASTKEIVYLDSGSVHLYPPAATAVLIEGEVRGELSALTLDGKRIHLDERGRINQRVPLYLRFGSNKFKIVAKDLAGNSTTEYMSIEIVSTEDQNNQDILDRLDDLEGSIDDLRY